jgi:hypothetical protein
VRREDRDPGGSSTIIFSLRVGIADEVRVNTIRNGISRFKTCSSSRTRSTARAACAASTALACIGIRTRSERVIARETIREAVPSRSTTTNWRPPLSRSMMPTIELSVTSEITRILVALSPCAQAAIGRFGSQSMSETVPPKWASVVPSTRAVVDLPAPPLGLATEMTGMGAASIGSATNLREETLSSR